MISKRAKIEIFSSFAHECQEQTVIINYQIINVSVSSTWVVRAVMRKFLGFVIFEDIWF